MSMEALISCMTAEGPAANRPPHMRLAGLSGVSVAACLEGFCRAMISGLVVAALGPIRHLSRSAAVLSVALTLATASAMAAEPPKFAGLAGDFSPIDPPL